MCSCGKREYRSDCVYRMAPCTRLRTLRRITRTEPGRPMLHRKKLATRWLWARRSLIVRRDAELA